MKSADCENLRVIHEDNHLLVVDKPAGMPSQPDDSGDVSLDVLAKEWLRVKYAKPGNVYLGLLHRLDRPTSGIVLLARTDKAASRMAEKFRRREVEKTYFAIVETADSLPDAGDADDTLEPNRSGGMRVARGGGGDKARKASLSWNVLARGDKGRALVRVALHSGVKHQIRCQLAWRGCPVVGDFRYGPKGAPARPRPVAEGRAILLHAGRVAFVHPVKGERLELSAPPPEFWRTFLQEFPSFSTEAHW